MIQARIRSPLRWLWAFIGSLTMLTVSGATGSPWFTLLIPVVIGLFLLGPPLGIFKHEEVVVPKAGLTLAVRLAEDQTGNPGSAPIARYTLSLVNHDAVDARDFSIRLLVPDAISPRNGMIKPLGRIHRGQVGKHWFTESAYDATALTFRTRIAPGDDVVCHAGETIDIAELHFLLDLEPDGWSLDYQVTGGSVSAALGAVRLP